MQRALLSLIRTRTVSLAGIILSGHFFACAPMADDDPQCRQFDEVLAAACTEQHFWSAFSQSALEPRKESEQLLIKTLARFPSPEDKHGSSLMHFRLGQLRLAMALENKQTDYVLHSDTAIVDEFHQAEMLHLQNGIIAPWVDAMQIAISAITQDWVQAKALAERGFANIALNPLGNTLSLSGTTIGFPLDTGVPQRTIAFLDKWECKGVSWCTENSAHAPFARPGLGFHFAEAYARVGNKEKARQYLDAALHAPGAERWPYRSVAQAAADNLDGFLKKFADLGQSGSAFDIAYANQPYGCLFCHAQP